MYLIHQNLPAMFLASVPNYVGFRTSNPGYGRLYYYEENNEIFHSLQFNIEKETCRVSVYVGEGAPQ